jgi:hypothetical protein
VYIGFWWGNLRKRDHWGDPGMGGRIILGCIFRKRGVGVWTGLGWLRIERNYECSNECSGTIKHGEFLD